jgi:Zn-dependent protease with chaperone function
MYQQIASNKRRSAIYVGSFFAVWVGIGAFAGLVVSGLVTRAPGLAAARTTDMVDGIVIAAVLALGAIAFSLRSGARLVLSLSVVHPADPYHYAQLHHLVEALAVGEGIAKPDLYVIDDPSPNDSPPGQPRPRRHHAHDRPGGHHEP